MTTRKLTISEIEDILDVIPLNRGLPTDVALGIQNNQKQGIKSQLEKIMVYPAVIPSIKQEVERQFYKSKIQAGEAVGIITAQSIGERQTQSTLNSFHHAGISMKTTVTGVPRFSELMNATKEPKAESCTVYFTKKFESVAELRKDINHGIIELKLENIIQPEYDIYIDKSGQDEWYELYNILYPSNLEDYNNFIRFRLNTQLLWEYNLSTDTIRKKIEDEYDDIKCVFSPDELGILDLYFSTINIKTSLNQQHSILNHIEDTIIPAILPIKVSDGVPKIQAVYPLKKDGEWIVETDGSNLSMLLAGDFIDQTRTISNNMWEIYNTLGIEAARNFLIEEFSAVVSSDGTYVNDSHIKLLVDIMTYNGAISSISRYGLKKENCGPLAKASFEESLENFTKAGLYGEIERLEGVSASVMLGKFTRTGSGLCDILVDLNNLPVVKTEPDGLLSKEVENKESKKDIISNSKISMMVGDITERITASIEIPLGILPSGFTSPLSLRSPTPKGLVSVKSHCNKKIYKDDKKDRVPQSDRCESLDPSDTKKRLQSVFKSSHNKRIVF